MMDIQESQSSTFSRIDFASAFNEVMRYSVLCKLINNWYFRDYVLNDPNNTVNFECGISTEWRTETYIHLVKQILPDILKAVMIRLSYKMLRINTDTELLKIFRYLKTFAEQRHPMMIMMGPKTYQRLANNKPFTKYLDNCNDLPCLEPLMDVNRNLPLLQIKEAHALYHIVICEYIPDNTIYAGEAYSLCDMALAVKINNTSRIEELDLTRIEYTIGYKICDVNTGELFQAFPNESPYYENEESWLLSHYHTKEASRDQDTDNDN